MHDEGHDQKQSTSEIFKDMLSQKRNMIMSKLTSFDSDVSINRLVYYRKPGERENFSIKNRCGHFLGEFSAIWITIDSGAGKFIQNFSVSKKPLSM